MLGGTFDPSLMCVMGGALAVSLPLTQWALRRSKPLCNVCYEVPSKTAVDANLLLGAALFGAGWGECQRWRAAGDRSWGCGDRAFAWQLLQSRVHPGAA